MKFKWVFQARSSVNKKADNFDDLEKYFEEARKRTYKNPLLVHLKSGIYTLYSDKGKINIAMHHSYDVWEEVK